MSITIILYDGNTKKELIVNPRQLYHIDYFRILFTNFKEKEDNEIQIIVPDTNISYDLIISEINGIIDLKDKDMHYLRKWYICQNFFLLKHDLSILENIKMDPKSFEILVDIFGLIGYDDSSVKILNKHVRENYCLSMIPRCILEKMLISSRMESILALSFNDDINILDYENGHSVGTIKKFNCFEGEFISCICICEINNHIAFGSFSGLKIYDLISMKEICTVANIYVNSIVYSSKGKYIFYSHENKIEIHKIVNQGIVFWKMLEYSNEIRINCTSNDDINIIVIGYNVNKIYICNLETNIRKTIDISPLLPIPSNLLCHEISNEKTPILAYMENSYLLIYDIDGMLINKIHINILCTFWIFVNYNKVILYEERGTKYGLVHIFNIKKNSIVNTIEIHPLIHDISYCISKNEKNIIFLVGMSMKYEKILIKLNSKSGIFKKMKLNVRSRICYIQHVIFDTYLSELIKKINK